MAHRRMRFDIVRRVDPDGRGNQRVGSIGALSGTAYAPEGRTAAEAPAGQAANRSTVTESDKMSADHRAATGRPRGSSRSCRWRSPRPEPAVHGCGLIEAGDLVAALAQRSHGSLPVEQVSGGVEPVGVGCVAGQRARTRGCRRRAPVRPARSFQTKNNGKQLIYALTWGQFLKLRVSGQPLRPFFVIPVRGTRSAPVPTVVLVVLGGDAGGGLFTELDVDAERGQVPVAGLGL